MKLLIVIGLCMLLLGCSATGHLDQAIQDVNKQINETQAEIDLAKQTNDKMEDKYIEKYLEVND